MRLMTGKEFNKLSDQQQKTGTVQKEKEDSARPLFAHAKVITTVYVLAHPDLGPADMYSFTFPVTVDGETITVEVVDGVVRTKDVRVKDFLIKYGYRYIREYDNKGGLN